MESDSYQVEILHYINPHMIWAQVKKSPDSQTFAFEQIGVYGVLPIEVKTKNFKFQRCLEWAPTVCTVMRDALDEAAEVWFVPTYIDRRRMSIFDKNVHKFGEIVIKKSDGKVEKLSQHLVKSGIGTEDECLFHQQLPNIKIKLDDRKIIEVIRELEKYYETKYTLDESKRRIECIKHQTSLFQKKHNLETALTMRNLEERNKQKLDRILKGDTKATKLPRAGNVNEQLLTMGPAGMNINRFLVQSLPVQDYEESLNVSYREDKEVLKEENILDGVDSDIDIEISNRDYLKTLFKRHFDDEENKDNNENVEKKIVKSKINAETVNSKQNVSSLEKLLKRRKIIVTKTSNSNKDYTSGSITNTKVDEDSDDGNIEEIIEKLCKQYGTKTPIQVKEHKEIVQQNHSESVNFVNPFQNVHLSQSVFVDKLITPVLMVHTKNDDKIVPRFQLGEVHFNMHIQHVLRNMSVQSPMTLQSVSWSTILRGYSLFMISPSGSGKTLGYVPAVCNHISDGVDGGDCIGPACIILCATSDSVNKVEQLCKDFLGAADRVLSCYAGVDELKLTTLLLNGCDIFVCTPPSLIRLLRPADFGIDLRRLSIVVFDDCDRLATVYSGELKIFKSNIKEMLKRRAHKEWKVQYILASKVWCDFMEPLAKKAPDTVICIGAFQECVLYSKAKTQVSFVKKDNKIDAVLDFLKNIDVSKKTVIVCCLDDEISVLEKVLSEKKYVVLACNNTMTIEELYKMNIVWSEYQEPVTGPILVCCDGNLNHMNVTDAHYLVHFSLPQSYSMFCKRFSVLNDNYASIFKTHNEHVKIKILLDECNKKHLPKILNFMKRYIDDLPLALQEFCKEVLAEVDAAKAELLVPICGKLLMLGECPEISTCKDRHAVFKEYDEPEQWMPKNGLITFAILHYHSAVSYSAKLLTNIVNGTTKKYPQTYGALSIKMGMYYSKEQNRKLHGYAEIGDVCAVSIRQHFFVRCQVVKIISRYRNGNPNNLLIKLLDEEKYDTTNDIYLYHLPDELKQIETKVVQVQLVNVHPKDNDVTFSNLAKAQLQEITSSDETLYLRGKVVMSVGKCVFIDTLEACQDLASLKETVVRYDLKKELLDTHALLDENHVEKLVKLCKELETCQDLYAKYESPKHFDLIQITEELREERRNQKKEDICEHGLDIVDKGNLDLKNVCSDIEEELIIGSDLKTKLEPVGSTSQSEFVDVPKNRQNEKKSVWAQLDEDMSSVYFTTGENPDEFFVRLTKFSDSIDVLLKDLQDYVNNKNPEPAKKITKGDIVIAQFPGDLMYERARIEEVYTDKVKCFYVDHGDWRDLPKKYVIPIPDQFLTALPFQAIECRLIGVKPAGEQWTEFSTNWFCDRFYEETQVYVKYFTKTPSVHTNGYKYGVVIIDTNSDEDVVINQLLIDLNLAKVNESEIECLNELSFNANIQSDEENNENEKINIDLGERQICAQQNSADDKIRVDSDERQISPLDNLFPKQPIRSMPLVQSDEDSDVDDMWDLHASEDFKTMFAPNNNTFSNSLNKAIMPAVDNEINDDKKVFKQHTNLKSAPQLEDVKFVSKYLPSPGTEELSGETYSSTKHMTGGEQFKLDQLRKPKILWRQSKKAVTINIQLLGVEEYNLEIMDRSMKFSAVTNDTEYGFDIDLYGVVDMTLSSHSNKGQYIRVNLIKLLKKNWLSLLRDGVMRKWILYDADSIDVSTDEEDLQKEPLAKIIEDIHYRDYDSDDDDFYDDCDLRF